MEPQVAQAGPSPARPSTEVALLVHPARWGLPSACPECLRACAYLCLACVPYSRVPCPAQITGDLPVLEDYSPPEDQRNSTSGAVPPAPAATSPQGQDQGTGAGAPAAHRGPVVVVSSSFSEGGGGVEGYLRVYRGVDLDAALSASEKLELVGLRALVDTYLHEALQVEVWASSSNRGVMGELFQASLPWPVSSITLWQQQRLHARRWAGSLQRPGLEGEGPKEQQLHPQTIARAVEAYSTLALRLGSGDLFFQDRPTSLDAALYSHLAFVLRAPWGKSALRDKVWALPSLEFFVRSMEQRLQRAEGELLAATAEGREGPLPPFTRIPLLKPFHPGHDRAEELRQKKKENESKRGGRLFIFGQVAAIVAYILVNLVAIEVSSDEEEDEEHVDEDEGDDDDDD